MTDKFISQLFYCDLFTKKNVGTKKQRKDLLDKILYLKKNNISPAEQSNKNCFRSAHMYGEELNWLRDAIKIFVEEISNFYKDHDESFNALISQDEQKLDFSIWTNVNEPGSINELHTHKGVSFACTYNLQTEGTGNLVFRNPANLLNDCNQKSPFIRNYKIEPKDGDLLIWPAWVPHYVEENKSNKQRINIATNIKLVDKNAIIINEGG